MENFGSWMEKFGQYFLPFLIKKKGLRITIRIRVPYNDLDNVPKRLKKKYFINVS
jgi:hypothetical protein